MTTTLSDFPETVTPTPDDTRIAQESSRKLARLLGARKKSVRFRIQPDDEGVFPTPDLHVEYRLQEAISAADIPLPKLHGFETNLDFLGAPFYVMELVPGWPGELRDAMNPIAQPWRDRIRRAEIPRCRSAVFQSSPPEVARACS